MKEVLWCFMYIKEKALGDNEATVIVSRNLRKNLEAVPGKHSIDSLQKQLYLEHHT